LGREESLFFFGEKGVSAGFFSEMGGFPSKLAPANSAGKKKKTLK